MRLPRQFMIAVIDGIGWNPGRPTCAASTSCGSTSRSTACTPSPPSTGSATTSKTPPGSDDCSDPGLRAAPRESDRTESDHDMATASQ